MIERHTLQGRTVCGARGVVRLQGAIGGGLVRGIDVCEREPGHAGPHVYRTVFPAGRLGLYQEAGGDEEERDA